VSCPHQPGPAWLVDGRHPGDARPTGTWGLMDQARFVGRTAWSLDRLFQLLGAWAAEPGCDETALAYAVVARQLAWHTQLLLERLPVLATVDPGDLLVPAPAWSAALEALAELSPEPVVARLSGLARGVLPRLRVELAWAIGEAGVDGPLARVLRHLQLDLDPAQLALEALCQRHLVDPAARRAATFAVDLVEGAFLGEAPAPVGPEATDQPARRDS